MAGCCSGVGLATLLARMRSWGARCWRAGAFWCRSARCWPSLVARCEGHQRQCIAGAAPSRNPNPPAAACCCSWTTCWQPLHRVPPVSCWAPSTLGCCACCRQTQVPGGACTVVWRWSSCALVELWPRVPIPALPGPKHHARIAEEAHATAMHEQRSDSRFLAPGQALEEAWAWYAACPAGRGHTGENTPHHAHTTAGGLTWTSGALT